MVAANPPQPHHIIRTRRAEQPHRLTPTINIFHSYIFINYNAISVTIFRLTTFPFSPFALTSTGASIFL